jgi:hypothetical protein
MDLLGDENVKEGRICINVNGEMSAYFRTFRDLSQGDRPLSPLLFNLVTDALGVMLNSTIRQGHISGVLTELIPGGSLTFNMLMTLSS